MPASSQHKGPSRTPARNALSKKTESYKRRGIKKEKTKYHKRKFTRDQAAAGAAARNGGSRARFDHNVTPRAKSARTKDIDINLASKVSSELRADLVNFKSRLSAANPFDAALTEIWHFVPPPFVQQHLPEEVRPYRSYLSKFERGLPSLVHAFLAWYEWSSYEVNKGKGKSSTNARAKHQQHQHSSAQRGESGNDNEDGDVGDEAEDEAEVDPAAGDGETAGRSSKKSRTRAALAATVQERSHVRALLQMCLRHNSARRREGQRAMLNHIRALLDDGVDCRSLRSLRETAHHAVPYTLARLLLGMVTEDLAMILLHAHTLCLVMHDTAVSPAVVLALLAEEFALDERLRAAQARLEARSPDTLDDVDPDDIADPTRGERNQRMVAAVFAIATVVANRQKLNADGARRVVEYLCFAYIEQRATRVLSANTLFIVLRAFPALWDDASVVKWLTFAFFHYPRLEYYRPEGIQLLLRLMALEQPLRRFSDAVIAVAANDPLEPSVVEQIANALFRREQVTSVHPMVHPVWDDWLGLITQRCAEGESLREHLSTMVHNAIAPYRRGNADAPRRALLQRLVERLGQLAVSHEDADTRAEMLQIAGRTVGYGRRAVAKPTDPAELRRLSPDALEAKVRDLLHQYRATRDADPAAVASRAWVLRELRACLHVPLRVGVSCRYADEAAAALVEFGLFPSPRPRDERAMNRAIFLFADVFSFTYTGAVTRPRCGLEPLRLITTYLEAEEKGLTRFTTGRTEKSFRRARNRIVEALESTGKRSVLFYKERDMQVLLTLLFFVLSCDDPSNADAKSLAESLAPDLCEFYQRGTLEALDLLYDVLMALVMRPTAPVHIVPLMTCARRIAIGYMLRFARFVRERTTLDLMLAPLRDAYHTDDRELARQAKVRGEKTTGDTDSEEDDDDIEEEEEENGSDGEMKKKRNKLNGDETFVEKDSASQSGSTSGSGSTSSASDDEEDDTETATVVDSDEASEKAGDDDDGDGDCEEQESQDDDDDSSDAEADDDDDDDAGDDKEDDDDDEDEDDGEEPPTEQYINALKGMVGNADLQFVYPTDTTSKEKSDVVRAIRTVARVGCSMRSALVVHIFQVLLAVCRENVKESDDVIFNSAVTSLELLMMTRNRYFGRFVAAEDLFQLFADIQGYCRKLDHVLVRREGQSARHAVIVRRRMARLKDIALRAFHFIAYLAHKNHAGEEVRVTLAEYYKSIFSDRGWDDRRRLPGIKRDMHHYRHGFAWAIVPAALEKFVEVEGVAGAQRVRVFRACCRITEAVLPRLSGIGAALRTSAGSAIASFLRAATLRELYEMKHTLLYDYIHCLHLVLKYNSRVGLDTAWLATIVTEAVDDDTLQLSSASIRLLASIERMLGLTPRARETKAPVPLKLLYQQYEKAGRKEKAAFYRHAKRVRAKVVRALLAHRNDDPTDAERAAKRRRKEELRIEDRLQRQVLRESQSATLTKEEREEKRKRIMAAKQERIGKNRERKRRLHEHREKAFLRWRENKLVTAAAVDGDENE